MDLAELRGRWVLIDFWATWCPPCILEIPELDAVWRAVRDRDVEVLAVSVDEIPLGELSAWVQDQGVEYPVVLADLGVAIAWGASELPYHVIIDPGGRVVERLEPGLHDRDELLAAIERHAGPQRR